jgi:hypothetical protein
MTRPEVLRVEIVRTSTEPRRNVAEFGRRAPQRSVFDFYGDQPLRNESGSGLCGPLRSSLAERTKRKRQCTGCGLGQAKMKDHHLLKRQRSILLFNEKSPLNTQAQTADQLRI